MGRGVRRTVGERGQVTIPKDLQERFGIGGGDEAVIREEKGTLVIDRPMTREEVADGYRKRGDRSRELAAELAGVSAEADAGLGDDPEW